MVSRPAKALPQPRSLSGGGKAEVVLSWETFSSGVKEALPLMKRHYAEAFDFTDKFPFNPQWEHYYELERQGALHVLSFRRKPDRLLVGYISIIVLPLLHTRDCLRARGDSFYILPAFRGGAGLSSPFLQAIREVERRMKELGVQRLEWVPKRKDGGHVDSGPVFRRLGYREVEYVFAKLL